MRPFLLVTLALLVAACAPGTDTTSPPPGTAPSVAMDSVVVADALLRFNAALVYPQLRDAGPYTAALNAALADSARAYVASFRPAAIPPAGCLTCVAEVDGATAVSLLTDRLFSALTTVYAYTGGAHGNHAFLPINLDLRTGQRIALEDLFAPGAAYLDTLATRTRASLAGQAAGLGLTADDFWAEGTAPDPENFRRFTLGPDSLTIHFPPYQVGPYAVGSFATPLAYTDLRPVLRAEGPVPPAPGP